MALRAVLLDLDDTLLGNDMDQFLPPYFAALGRRMAPFVAPDDLVKMLLASTQAMMKNNSYENSHFCKPNPRYYQEILDRLDCRPDEAIMIGDDWENDIEPAARAGLRTYWIEDRSASVGADSGLRGSLTDCLTWVQSGGLCQL